MVSTVRVKTDDYQNWWSNHIVRDNNIETQYCIPKTNITNIGLYTNYT